MNTQQITTSCFGPSNLNSLEHKTNLPSQAQTPSETPPATVSTAPPVHSENVKTTLRIVKSTLATLGLELTVEEKSLTLREWLQRQFFLLHDKHAEKNSIQHLQQLFGAIQVLWDHQNPEFSNNLKSKVTPLLEALLKDDRRLRLSFGLLCSKTTLFNFKIEAILQESEVPLPALDFIGQMRAFQITWDPGIAVVTTYLDRVIANRKDYVTKNSNQITERFEEKKGFRRKPGEMKVAKMSMEDQAFVTRVLERDQSHLKRLETLSTFYESLRVTIADKMQKLATVWKVGHTAIAKEIFDCIDEQIAVYTTLLQGTSKLQEELKEQGKETGAIKSKRHKEKEDILATAQSSVAKCLQTNNKLSDDERTRIHKKFSEIFTNIASWNRLQGPSIVAKWNDKIVEGIKDQNAASIDKWFLEIDKQLTFGYTHQSLLSSPDGDDTAHATVVSLTCCLQSSIAFWKNYETQLHLCLDSQPQMAFLQASSSERSLDWITEPSFIENNQKEILQETDELKEDEEEPVEEYSAAAMEPTIALLLKANQVEVQAKNLEEFAESVGEWTKNYAEVVSQSRSHYLRGYSDVTANTRCYLASSYDISAFHQFNAGSVFELAIRASVTQDYQSLGLLLPKLFLSWHLMLERFFQIDYLAKYNDFFPSHSLTQLARQAEWWDSLNGSLKALLEKIDEANIWFRYPKSSAERWKRDHGSAPMPEALQYNLFCNKLLAKTRLVPADLEAICKFVVDAHKTIFSFLLNQFTQLSKPAQALLKAKKNLDSLHAEGALVALLAEAIQESPAEKKENTTSSAEKDSVQTTVEKLNKTVNLLKNTPIVRWAVEDARTMLTRVGVAKRLAEEQSAIAFSLAHVGNLMNMQWVFENCYAALCSLKSQGMFAHHHDFTILSGRLRLSDDALAQKRDDAEIQKFNYRLAFHYPFEHERGRRLVPLFAYAKQYCGVPKGFVKQGVKSLENNFFEEVVASWNAGMKQVSLMTEDILEAVKS